MRSLALLVLIWLVWSLAPARGASDPATSVSGPGPGLQEAAAVSGGPLQVRVAYSVRLNQRPGWYDQFRCAVRRAGGYLEPVLGRNLRIRGRVPWNGGSQAVSVYDLRRNLVENVDPGPADIVIGLAAAVGQDPSERLFWPTAEDQGLASYTHGYVVLRAEEGDLCDAARLLAHELAHVFGGVHRDGQKYLMDRLGKGVQIDPLNAELFALHRGRQFGPGLAPLEGEQLRAMWGLAEATLDTPRTWLVVGTLAAHMGKPPEAMRYYQRALDLDQDYTPALVNLGHACFQVGDLALAERHYRRALELGPQEVGLVHNNLAAIHYSRGDHQEAARLLRQALAAGYQAHPQFIEEVEKVTGQKLQ